MAIRGASAGFSVLLVGPLLAQLTTAFLPPAAVQSLIYISVALGFTLAARRVGIASVPVLHGATAASLAYLLVLPLQWHFGRPSLPEVLFTVAAALSIGALTGWIHSQARN